MARLYEFLAPVNEGAAARTVQVLTTALANLSANPRIGERLEEFDPWKIRRILVGHMRCATKFRNPLSTYCGCGIRARIDNMGNLWYRP